MSESELIYRCIDCESCFGSYSQLRSHISVVHLGFVPYKCFYCSRLHCGSQEELMAHIRSRHPEKVESGEMHLICKGDRSKERELELLMAESLNRHFKVRDTQPAPPLTSPPAKKTPQPMATPTSVTPPYIQGSSSNQDLPFAVGGKDRSSSSKDVKDDDDESVQSIPQIIKFKQKRKTKEPPQSPLKPQATWPVNSQISPKTTTVHRHTSIYPSAIEMNLGEEASSSSSAVPAPPPSCYASTSGHMQLSPQPSFGIPFPNPFLNFSSGLLAATTTAQAPEDPKKQRRLKFCKMCKQQVPMNNASNHILYSHMKEKMFQCGYCAHRSNTIYQLRVHLTTIHKNQPMRHTNLRTMLTNSEKYRVIKELCFD